MEHFIDHISIKNFKSIRDLKIEGLRRINLFIGKPNVGKSNILEAFGIFSLPYLKTNFKIKLNNLIRTENISELFYDGNRQKSIFIETNISTLNIEYKKEAIEKKGGKFPSLNIKVPHINMIINNIDTQIDFDEQLNIKFSKEVFKNSNFKFYLFNKFHQNKKNGLNFLIPPSGSNLMEIIENQDELRASIKTLFQEYGLYIVFDRGSGQLKIIKDFTQDEDEIFLIPYNSIADTLQRVIFYKTAIASNSNSILIFEEPEAHAFPPYIVHITQEIVESKTNQFMISTHSPYVLNHFIENAKDDLAIFMVDYQNGETVLNCLTKKDIDYIQEYGIDLFTNYETFLK